MWFSMSRRPLWLTCCSWTCTALKRKWEGSWTRLWKRWEWRKSSLSSTPHGQVQGGDTLFQPHCPLFSALWLSVIMCFSPCHPEFVTYWQSVSIPSRYAVPVRAPPSDPGAPPAHRRGADRDAGRQPGAAAEPHVIQVHRPLPGRSVVMAKQTVGGRLCHLHLVRGAADVDPPREHLHWLRRHPLTAAWGYTLNR